MIGAQQPPVLAELERRFVVHKVYAEPDPFAALAKVGANVRGAVGHGMAGLTRRHIELTPKLEICALNGVGLETSDLPAIRERGIVLTTRPRFCSDDVADLAIALALGCCRQIALADRFVRAGRWGAERLRLGRKLTGMRAGVLGLGRIGIESCQEARRLQDARPATPPTRSVAMFFTSGSPTRATLAENSDILFQRPAARRVRR